MAAPLSALEEHALLQSLGGAPSAQERADFLAGLARAAALQRQQSPPQPKPDDAPPQTPQQQQHPDLDAIAPPLHHGALPGLTIGSSGGRARELLGEWVAR